MTLEAISQVSVQLALCEKLKIWSILLLFCLWMLRLSHPRTSTAWERIIPSDKEGKRGRDGDNRCFATFLNKRKSVPFTVRIVVQHWMGH